MDKSANGDVRPIRSKAAAPESWIGYIDWVDFPSLGPWFGKRSGGYAWTTGPKSSPAIRHVWNCAPVDAPGRPSGGRAWTIGRANEADIRLENPRVSPTSRGPAANAGRVGPGQPQQQWDVRQRPAGRESDDQAAHHRGAGFGVLRRGAGAASRWPTDRPRPTGRRQRPAERTARPVGETTVVRPPDRGAHIDQLVVDDRARARTTTSSSTTCWSPGTMQLAALR